MLLFSDVETNECLNNNGGCWQDKAANISACKVPVRLRMILPLVAHVTNSCIRGLRIHFVEEYVNAPSVMVCFLKEMVTRPV